MADLTAPAFARHPVVRSIRRSRVRKLTLLALARRGSAHAAELAAATGVSARWIRPALLGGLPDFQPRLAPAALGLVVPGHDEHGECFRITEAGRAVAAVLEEEG